MVRHHSTATIRKIRAAQTGKKNSFYGKTHSPKTRAKFSRLRMGKNNPMYGKHHSAETKRKIRLAIRRARLKRSS